MYRTVLLQLNIVASHTSTATKKSAAFILFNFHSPFSGLGFIKKTLLLCLCFAGAAIFSYAQKIAGFEISLKPPHTLSAPASINLDEITFLHDSVLTLVEVTGNKRTPVAYQIQNNNHRTLHWLVEPGKGKHVYELVKSKASNNSRVNAKMDNVALIIQSGNKSLLSYFYKTVYPPAGIDTNYKRSGFIHPLWTPNGQELTRIQAPDHYHHYGI